MNGFGNYIPASSTSSPSRTASRRQAFTLVELLVVIVIIAILIALLVPTVGGALRAAKNARMGLEIGNLGKAIEAYKNEMGSYPPDFANLDDDVDTAQVNKHLQRKFRYRKPTDLAAVKNLDPAEALVFWLRGFSPDPKNPLTGAGARTPMFDFDQKRLDDRDGDDFPEYYPNGSEMPLVYLHHENYGTLNAKTGAYTANPITILNGAVGPLTAYVAELTGMSIKRFAEPEKFQILCAGLDGKFGDGSISVYPDGLGYSLAEQDNITNFSEGKTLEAAIP